MLQDSLISPYDYSARFLLRVDKCKMPFLPPMGDPPNTDYRYNGGRQNRGQKKQP